MDNICLVSYSHKNICGSGESSPQNFYWSQPWTAISLLLCSSITGDGRLGRGLLFDEASWVSVRMYVSKIDTYFLSVSVMDYICHSLYSLVTFRLLRKIHSGWTLTQSSIQNQLSYCGTRLSSLPNATWASGQGCAGIYGGKSCCNIMFHCKSNPQLDVCSMLHQHAVLMGWAARAAGEGEFAWHV